MRKSKQSFGQGFSGVLAKASQVALTKALAGDDEAAYAVIWVVLARLAAYSLPPKPLHDFFLEVVRDPDRYSRIMSKNKLPRQRGRPSIDDKPRAALPAGLGVNKEFFW